MVDPATRAKMVANRRTDTRPEVELRRELHRRGFRYRKDYRVDLGLGRANPRPDIAFTRRRLAVFVDGCFWHSCPKHGRIPKSNVAFWQAKFDRNRERDRRNDRALREAGWLVLRVWEHQPITEASAAVEEAIEEAASG